MVFSFFSRYDNILPEIMLCLVGAYFFSVYYTRPQEALTPAQTDQVESMQGGHFETNILEGKSR